MAGTVLAYGAAKVADSENGRKIIGAVLAALIGFFFIVGSIVSSTVSIFANEEDMGSDFDAKETEIYNEVRALYDEYVMEAKEKMKEIEEELTDKYMDTKIVWIYSGEKKKYIPVEEDYCRADFKQSYQYINSSYVMAYLSCIHKREYMSGNIHLDKRELEAFWDKVSGIKVDEEANLNFHIHNEVLSPSEIAEIYFADETEQRLFIESVYIIGQFIGEEYFYENVNIGEAASMSIPLYYQYQSPWGNKPYGNGTIAKNGCAPACIAMVFSYLEGGRITPDDITAYTKNNYYVTGVGSSWSIFEACATEWGIDCNYIGTSTEAIVQALTSGKPVILSMGPGTFTQSGHFIVLTGISESGMITVNDPNDNGRKNHAGREFGISQIVSEAKGGWSFD